MYTPSFSFFLTHIQTSHTYFYTSGCTCKFAPLPIFLFLPPQSDIFIRLSVNLVCDWAMCGLWQVFLWGYWQRRNSGFPLLLCACSSWLQGQDYPLHFLYLTHLFVFGIQNILSVAYSDLSIVDGVKVWRRFQGNSTIYNKRNQYQNHSCLLIPPSTLSTLIVVPHCSAQQVHPTITKPTVQSRLLNFGRWYY